jgi:hypothetical protein
MNIKIAERGFGQSVSSVLEQKFSPFFFEPTYKFTCLHVHAQIVMLLTVEARDTHVGLEVFTAVVMNSSIFWDITLCSLLIANQRFGGICRLHL